MKEKNKEVQSEEDFKDRRGYQRVIVRQREGSLSALLGALAKWPSGAEVAVYDISHSGMAVARPEREDIKQNQLVALSLDLPGHSDLKITGQVKWCNDTVVGVHFEPLSVEARQSVGDYLDEKLVGLHLQLIDEQFYNKELDCDLWYQGRHGTNVYMWTENAKITKAIVEFDKQMLLLEDGELHVGGAEEAEEVGYERDEKIEVANAFSEKDIIQRSIDILSQAEGDNHRFLQKLLEEIVELSV